MAKFVFSLEGVLRHRKRLERQKRRELAEVQARMTELTRRLHELDVTVKQITEDVRQNRLVGRLDLSFITAHRRFTLAMQRKAMDLAGLMAQEQRRIDEARKLYIEAAKKRKILEKLRERQEQRWREQLDRRERAEMDEIGTQLSYRQE